MPPSQSGAASLSSSVVRGARDLFLGQALKLAIQLAGLVILSRLLTPAAFGFAAIATTIVGFGEILRDFGLSSASIRMPHLTRGQQSVLFWINVAVGVILAGVAILSAGLFADLFDIPQLHGIISVIGVVFLINGIAAQYRADLNRTLRFRAMASIDVLAAAVGLLVAIVAAALGAGYWALVVQFITIAFLSMVMAVFFGRWVPGLPRRGTGALPIVKFGAHVSLSQLFSYGGNNVDTLALGYFSTPFNVGLYARAFQLVMAPLNQLKSPALSVAIPALSRISGERERFNRYLLRGQGMIGYVVVPVAAILAAASGPIVEVALGPQWAAAAPVVSLLAVAGALQQLSSVANWIFVSHGLGRDLSTYSFVSLVLKVIAVISLAWAGPVGIALGYTLAVCIAWPIAIIWACRRASVPASPLIVQAIRILLIAAIAGGSAYAVVHYLTDDLGAVWVLAAASAALGATYLLTLAIPIVRRDLAAVISTFRTAVLRKRR